MSKIQIDLYFDIFSPYSWIAFEALLRLKDQWNVELKLKPFDLGAIMKSTGNRPPAMVMAKGLYMLKDLERNAQLWEMQLNQPTEFMQWIRKYRTIEASKLLIASKDQIIPLARELWMRLWSRDQKVFEEADLKEAMQSIGIKNISQLLAEMKNPKVEEELKANTQTAIDQGAFGAPWIVVHIGGEEHCYFGSDRFPLIANLIGKQFNIPLAPQTSKI